MGFGGVDVVRLRLFAMTSVFSRAGALQIPTDFTQEAILASKIHLINRILALFFILTMI